MVNKTKTWEIAISDEEKASKNYKFKRIANMALRQHIIESTYDQNPVEEIKDNQMEYESPYQIKKIKGKVNFRYKGETGSESNSRSGLRTIRL